LAANRAKAPGAATNVPSHSTGDQQAVNGRMARA